MFKFGIILPLLIASLACQASGKALFTQPQHRFIENKGQVIDQNNKPNPAVLYLLNTPGMNVQLRRGGFSYDLYASPPGPLSHGERGSAFSRGDTTPLSLRRGAGGEVFFHRIDIDLQNANPKPAIETSVPSTDYLNYYTTGTPAEGVIGVKSFCSVTYKNIYPGIDLQFVAGNDRLFEYNFVVRPGADLASIRLKVAGPEKIKHNRDGIHLETSIGEVDETIPLCYYTLNNNQVPVKGRFKKISDHLYGFSVDQIIPDGAVLLIDPVPTRRWGTFYGGNLHTNAGENACAIDGSGNCIVAGSTQSIDNIASSGAYQVTLAGVNNAILVKFSPDGQRLWGTYYGGSGGDDAICCAVDRNDNIIFAGEASSPNNIASPGAYQTILHGESDAMLVKFTPGGQRIWGTYFGGNQTFPWGDEAIEACAVDTNGNIYCAGETSSPDYIASPGAHQVNIGGMSDAFLAKFTADGQRLWGTYYGGSNLDQNGCVAVSKNGFVFLSGNTISPNNIATPGSFMPNFNATQKSFLAAFNLDGQRLWGTYYAGEVDDWNYGCTADTGSNVYIYGTTSSFTNISTPGVFQETQNGNGNGYLTKFNSNGQRIWGTYYGADNVWLKGAVIDDSANVVICGDASTQNTVIASQGGFQTIYRGGWHDAFLGKLNSNGQRFWGTYYGGTGQEDAVSCAVDKNDNIYLCGNTYSANNSDLNTSLCTRSSLSNYIATPGAFQTENIGLLDMFLVKFADCYSPDTALKINGPLEICATTSGVIYSIAPIVAATDYHWCVSGDLTITSGQHTTSITVDAGPLAGIDTISVYGINSCDKGFPIYILITVVPRPVPVINGPDTVCAADTAIFHTTGGMVSYLWTFSAGGNVITGGTPADSSMSVAWNSPGAHWVALNYTSDGCTSLALTTKAVWVNPGLPVDITITPSASPVCTGTPVTFTAFPVNGGSNPDYQWRVNGIHVWFNNPVFTYIPQDGDMVKCILTSHVPCAKGSPDTSNMVTMIVLPTLPAGVTIGASANPVCAGSTVTFTAAPSNGGTNPLYHWLVNSLDAGINNPVYAYIPNNNDVVKCIMTSDWWCATGNPDTSNSVIMTVTPDLVAGIGITASSNPICQGNPVTFTAVPVNGGLSPSYQWKVNASNATNASNAVYTYVPNNGDIVQCILNSSITQCISNNPAASNIVIMSVLSNIVVGVSVLPSANPSCAGSPVTFTAIPAGGGLTPGYQWKVNAVNVTNATNAVYTYTPVNGDLVSCILNSSAACITGNPATSPPVTMTVNPLLPVSVSIVSSANPFCLGNPVTFTATPVNGGATPSYQWKVNANNVNNATNAVYTYTPVSGDLVSCILNSSEICESGNPGMSNIISMIVNNNLPAGVTIAASSNPFCPGSTVTFTATPANGGSTPSYQWKVNASNVNNATNASYAYNAVNGDVVSCVMNSNLNCVTGNPATSNSITLVERLAPVVTFTSCFDTITTISAKPIRLKGGLPIGGQYNGPGVNNSTGIFTPSAAGTGVKTILYSYSNIYTCISSKSKTILVLPNPAFTCGNNLTDIRDNKVCATVQLGSQCWMKENLDFGFRISELIPQTDNCTPERYLNPNSEISNPKSVYQWDELMQYASTEAVQGLCPPGWHIPSSAEWSTLLIFLNGPGQAGGPLKDTLLANGFHSYQQGFLLLNNTWGFVTGPDAGTMYWTSTASGSGRAVVRGLNEFNPSVSIYLSSRGNAFSARCLKD